MHKECEKSIKSAFYIFILLPIFSSFLFPIVSYPFDGEFSGRFRIYPPPYLNWNKVNVEGIAIYYEESVSVWIPKIYSIIKESVDDFSRLFGRKPQDLKLVVFFTKDIIDIDVDVYRKIAFLNIGGTRYDFPPFYTLEDFIRFALACSYFQSFPPNFPPQLQFFPLDTILSYEDISALCEYTGLKSKERKLGGGIDMTEIIFSPFISERAKMLWFAEKQKGKKVIRYFSDELLRMESTAEFENFRKKSFEILKESMKSAYGRISEIKTEKNIKSFRNFQENHDFYENFISVGIHTRFLPFSNSDGKISVSETLKDGFIKIFIETPSGRFDVPTEGRAWYPTLRFFEEKRKGRIFFVEKHISYDKLCFVDFLLSDKPVFQKKRCVAKSDDFEEFFSPNLSRDGKLVVFSIRRKNNFVDIAYIHINESADEDNELGVPDKKINPNEKRDSDKDGDYTDVFFKMNFLTQDRFIDIFPKWGEDGKKIFFSSDRDGFFSVFALELENGSFTNSENLLPNLRLKKLIDYPSHIILSEIGKDALYFSLYQHGEILFGSAEIQDGREMPFRRESIVIEMKEDVDFKSSSAFSFPGILRFPIPSFFVSDAGFAVFGLSFAFSDAFFRHILSFEINYRTPFNLYQSLPGGNAENIILVEGGNLGVSSSLLARYFRPFLFISFSADDFSGVFVRIKGENQDFYEFFPERKNIAKAFLIYPTKSFLWFRDSFIFLGGRVGSIKSDIPLRSETDLFWRKIGEEYTENYGYGSFFGGDIGFLLRVADYKRGILTSGVDIKTFFGFRRFSQIQKSIYTLDFSSDIWSPEFFRFITLSFKLTYFLRFGDILRRFYGKVGAKEVPFYYDPPPFLSPHLRFGILTLDPDSLLWDVGLIRGVPELRDVSGATFSFQPNFRVLSFSGRTIMNSFYLFFSPFISFGLVPISKDGKKFISFGVETRSNFVIFNELPLSLTLGIARGTITDIYLFLTLIPGVLR